MEDGPGNQRTADPTPRTLEFAARETESLRDLINEKFLNVQSIIEAMDKAILLLQQRADKQPQPIENKLEINALRELMETKVLSLRELVDAKFDGNNTALDAALKTQKEASDKIEGNFTKQFENVQEIIRTTGKAGEDKINDVKDRLTAIESRTSGVHEQKQESKDSRGFVIGAIGASVAVISLLITVFSIAMIFAEKGTAP